VFKRNGSEIQFNSIQFSQEYSNQRNVRKEKKNQTRTQDITKFDLKMPTSPGLSTSNNWGWAEALKNSFTLVELGPLHKNGLSSLSVIRVTTHSKRWVTTHSKIKSEWQHTQEKGKHYNSRKVSTTAQKTIYKTITKDQVGRIERS
jgi:hypothetical protein